MKKSQMQLAKLAEKFQYKYGQSQTLKEIIQNASSYGQDIMNFVPQLVKDQADLSITITVNDKFMGGRGAEVSEPVVSPSEVAGHYAGLSEQIRKYLDKNLRFFPQVPPGSSTLRWSGVSDAGVAKR